MNYSRFFKTAILLLHFFLLEGLLNAEASQFQDQVTLFWKLDQKNTQIMERIVSYSEKYHTTLFFEKLSSEDTLELIGNYMELLRLRKTLKEETDGYTNTLVTKLKFSKIFGEKSSITANEYIKLLLNTMADMVLYEQMSLLLHVGYKNIINDYPDRSTSVTGSDFHKFRDPLYYIESVLMNSGNRSHFKDALKLVDQHSELFLKLSRKHGFLPALIQRMDNYFIRMLLEKKSFIDELGSWIGHYLKGLSQNNHISYGQLEYFLSKMFGNASGALNIQKYLQCISEAELTRIRNEVLQPGDVIVEKTKGALTDKFIPGQYGHVAIYFGRVEQIKNIILGSGERLIDQPVVKKYLSNLLNHETNG